jgi:ribosome-associated protein
MGSGTIVPMNVAREPPEPMDPDESKEAFDEVSIEPPSKSARKRAAHDAQKLGEDLVELRETEFAKLDLPERLQDAIRAARTIKTRGGLARQRQLIGKLMRDIDPLPILEALGEKSRNDALESERFKRTEAWRDRLIREGEAGLAALAEWRTGADDPELRSLVARARDRTRPEPDRHAAGRALFQRLRTLFATPAG